MARRLGLQTVELSRKPKIITAYAIVGPKEGEGPLKEYFHEILSNDMCECKSFELAESKMHYKAVTSCIKKAGLNETDVDYIFAGDLLNQIMASTFMARDLDVPFIGLYSACSTFTEAITMASMSIEAEFASYAIASTSSHFSSAERQFRLPLEMGSQRSPASQWTVTGAGALLLGSYGNYPYVTHVTTGKVKDYGIKDPNEMGAAMAPAAVDTLKQHFQDTNRKPSDYDLIVSGDLGKVGKTITIELLKEYGYNIESSYIDCGDEIFEHEKQGTNCGGSGAGCSASVMSSMIYQGLLSQKYKRVLLIATGALLSATSALQGESIPAIAHAVVLEYGGE
ncbi:stage V sporulation protein AD [Clostridium sp.]|uniref:stage V sporulation protein AD n=1 Tax=Clostridium sp. TaxID=1506 RepID=UPI002FCBBE6A